MEKMEESSETNSRSVREMSITDFPLFPRDLLRRFTPARSDLNEQTQNAAVAGDGDEDEEGDEEEGGVELNLGLSLGGRFGIESSSGNPNRLKRSSSIAGTMPTFREEKSSGAAAAAMETPPVAAHTATGLMRTTSLPVGTEEEWKKRKEMQSLRRKEAKRRRSEKQRNHGNADRSSCRGLPRWSAGVNKAGILQKSRERISLDSHGGDYGGGGGGGSSSSLSEFDSKCVQGSNNNSNGRSHVANQPSQEADGTSSAKTPNSTRRAGNTLRRLSSVDMNLQVKGGEEEDNMPCVFTRGEGPDGRRVDGILYRYGRGEDVRIMCVCHGDFLSPAEFVRHAGGREVDHPLRHIVVNAPAAAAAAATAALFL